LLDIERDVLARLSQRARRGRQRCATQQQQRPRIVASKGREGAQRLRCARVELRDAAFGIDDCPAHKIARRQSRVGVVDERPREIAQSIRSNLEARCHRVPAERFQMLTARSERGVQVESVDRTSRPVAQLAVALEQDRRPVVQTHQPRTTDADDAPMPRLVALHDCAMLRRRHPQVDREGPGVIRNHRFRFAAFIVPAGERFGDLSRPRLVRSCEQFERFARVAEPSDGVQPRAKTETDVGGFDILAPEPGLVAERPHACELASLDLIETEPRDHAILSAKRDDIRDDPHCSERQEFDQHPLQFVPCLLRPALERCEAPSDLERDTRPAQIRKWIGRVARRQRVNHGECFRQIRLIAGRRVVIGDDQVDATIARDLSRTNCGHPAVNADDEIVRVAELRDRLRVQAVSLFQPVGQIGRDGCFRVDCSDHPPQNRRSGNAIDVIVGVDHNPLAGADGGEDAGRGSIQPREQRGIVKVFQ